MKERNKSILRGSDKPYLDPLPKQTRTRAPQPPYEGKRGRTTNTSPNIGKRQTEKQSVTIQRSILTRKGITADPTPNNYRKQETMAAQN